MSKRTVTKNLRMFDYNFMAEQKLIPRDTPRPPDARKTYIVKCGVYDIPVLLSEGQRINPSKVCKRFFAEQSKVENKRLKNK